MKDTLTMSKREREYLDVMQRIERGELTRSAAASMLDLSERHVYRLLEWYRTDGDGGVVHGLRGRSSNRGYGPEIRSQVTGLYRQREFSDYGPQLFSEVLYERLRLRLSAETVRQWLMKDGLWSGRRAPRRHRKKRDRREGIGSLVQFDGSPHDWFEGRGPACCLLVAIDDASSRVFMRFAPSEDTEHVMRTLWEYMERYGIPQALYTDHGSVYAPRKDDSETVTELGRALQTLGVKLIFANSPQAKGRVERSNRTHQDRLIKALRRNGISTIEEANRYLDEHYLAEHNEDYACVDGQLDVHRTIFGLKLEDIFCFEEQRKVNNDYTVQYEGSFIQLERSESPLPPLRATVTIRRWLDGSLHIYWNETELAYRVLEGKPEPKPPQKPPRNHPWRGKPVSPKGAQKLEKNLSVPSKFFRPTASRT
jgi:hypothetical protein